MHSSIKIIAPAKINLNLSIINKLNNGYHSLKSDLIFLDLCDEISIKRSNSNKIIIDRNNSKSFLQSDTILKKTLDIFNSEFENNECFQIILKKNIPVGAGLGGGSANSAAVLLGLRFLYNVNTNNKNKISIKTLKKIGLKIGSDVPVCIVSKSQRLEGIGEKLKIINIPSNYYFLVVFPNINLSTKAVFKNYDISETTILDISYFEKIKIYNSLLIPAQKLAPTIENTLNTLKSFKKIIAYGMTGSGSSCFGIFKNKEDFITEKEYYNLKFVNKFFIWHGNKKEFGYNRLLT